MSEEDYSLEALGAKIWGNVEKILGRMSPEERWCVFGQDMILAIDNALSNAEDGLNITQFGLLTMVLFANILAEFRPDLLEKYKPLFEKWGIEKIREGTE